MAVRNGAKTQCWLYDIIFSVHSFLAFINAFWAAVYVLEVLLPVIRGAQLGGVIMLVALAVEFPARWASAVIIFASFYFYRDWSVLSTGRPPWLVLSDVKFYGFLLCGNDLYSRGAPFIL